MALQFPKAQAFRHNQWKIVTFTEPGNVEVVEFCELDTGKLIARKQRERRTSGADGPWEWTYGSPVEEAREVEAIAVSSNNPVFSRSDSADYWEWRVRQIKFPANFYNVTVDEVRNQIVIRTTNKKYFKRIDAPKGEKFDASKVEWAWAYNTLVVKHAKPARVKVADQEYQKWRRSLPCAEDQEPNCQTQ